MVEILRLFILKSRLNNNRPILVKTPADLLKYYYIKTTPSGVVFCFLNDLQLAFSNYLC